MNKLKKYTVLVMSFLLLSLPVLSVSAAAPEKNDEGYYYFVNLSGRRADYYEHYFTYNATAGGYSDNLLAALYDTTTYEYCILNLYSITDGEVSLISRNASIPVLSYEVLADTGHADSDNFFKVGNNLYPSIIKGEWHDFGEKKLSSYQDITTNIPYFSTEEQVIHYLETGDLTGNQNPYDPMDDLELDTTYKFIGFSATSEGKNGSIKVKWSGTSHDKMAGNYTKMEYYVSATYTTGEGDTGHGGGGGSRDVDSTEHGGGGSSRGDDEDISSEVYTESNIFSGNISEKGFSKLYNFFRPPDSTYYLHSLKITPTYTIGYGSSEKTKRGWPYSIYFDTDGNLTTGDGEHGGGGGSKDAYDFDFELSGLQVSRLSGLLVVDKTSRQIYWSSTTKDSFIKELGYSNTGVNVYCIGVNSENNTIEKIPYENIDKYFLTPYVHQNFLTTSNSFDVSGKEIETYIEGLGLKFNGLLYLEPYYVEGITEFSGKISVINIYTGDTSAIDPGDSDNPPDTPDLPDEPDLPDDPDLPDIDNIESPLDIFPYFLKLIKGFFVDIGQIPVFLSYLFSFLPRNVMHILEASLICALILRILGR